MTEFIGYMLSFILALLINITTLHWTVHLLCYKRIFFFVNLCKKKYYNHLILTTVQKQGLPIADHLTSYSNFFYYHVVNGSSHAPPHFIKFYHTTLWKCGRHHRISTASLATKSIKKNTFTPIENTKKQSWLRL